MFIPAAIAIALLQPSATARALPDGATDVTSNVSNVPNFLVYYSVTAGCVENANPASTKTSYLARLVQGTTLVDVSVEIYASTPERARTQVRAILQKVGTLDYAALK
jgi:hypothetical protein